MNYLLKRGEQQYGPYTLAELQQYVQSGNIAMTDLAQSEGMTGWAPISQVIGNVAVPVAPSAPGYSQPFQPQAGFVDPTLVPMPSYLQLPWWALLLAEIFTRGIFTIVWAMMQGNWARKLNGDRNIMVLLAMCPAGVIAFFIAAVGSAVSEKPVGMALGFLFFMGGLAAYTVGQFKIKAAMEEYYNSKENAGLQLDGVMVFFFGTLYLQHRINAIHQWRQTGFLN